MLFSSTQPSLLMSIILEKEYTPHIYAVYFTSHSVFTHCVPTEYVVYLTDKGNSKSEFFRKLKLE
jgi:hypothetical protein